MILIDAEGNEVMVGQEVTSFRGEVETVRAISRPRHPGSTGRVLTDRGEFYPGVYNLKWVEGV